MSKIKELKAKYQAIKKEMGESGKTALKEVFSEFFEKHPEIKGISWTQYTPYFNDGDTCIFSINDPEFKLHPKCIKDLDEDVKKDFFEYVSEEDYLSDIYSTNNEQCFLSVITDKKNKTDAENQLIKDAKEVLEAFSLGEIFKNTFGDHVKVIATRKGFNVEEYEHD